MADKIIRPSFTRRGALGAGLVAGSGLVASCGGVSQVAAQGVTLLTPEVTEGPFYFDPAIERDDIREDKPGVPVRLRIRVFDAQSRPMRNARVDIWHCDASGLYSGYANQTGGVSTEGQKFLRGHQLTDAAGDVAFTTIYPGWYHGRTTHLHQKVYIGDRNVLTAQIFLPDALSEYIYANAEAYRRSEQRDTLNSQDGIAEQQGRSTFGAVKEETDYFEVSLTLGVDPNHTSTEQGGPGGPPPTGRPPGPPPNGAPGPMGRGEPLTPAERVARILPGG
ncbi:MAG: intradiol ring-cleavage dioxygenase [Hyphomonadaceae bacterium]|nr:intradiol ring-cleavage dioxygenase [Hyphomonadaceae bacterium]